jgi:HD-like signal output (HDOD) protein
MTATVTAPPGVAQAMLSNIPSFRPVTVRLLRVLGDDDVSLVDVTELLNADPGFSVEILAAANSAAYGISRRVNTTARAVIMLGLERTKALATRAALGAMMRGMGNHPAIGHCWLHSRATAAVAQWLAPAFGGHPDRAYTAGLIHDIGRLGLLSLDTRGYGEILAAAGPGESDVLEAERSVLRIDHCQAGAWLTQHWDFPDELQQAAFRHHDPGAMSVVRAACTLAHAFGYRAALKIETLPPAAIAAALGRDIRDLDSLPARLQKELGPPPA